MIKDFLNALLEWDISINSTIIIFAVCIVFVRLILWLFGAIGVYRLSKENSLEKSAMCFVPFLYQFSFGKIAEKIQGEETEKPTKFSVWLMVLSILSVVFYIAFFFSGTISFTTITEYALKSIELDSSMTIDMFYSAVYAICFYFTALVVYICYFVLFRVSLWKILKKYEEKAVLYTVISVVLPFLTPLLIFAVSIMIIECREIDRISRQSR